MKTSSEPQYPNFSHRINFNKTSNVRPYLNKLEITDLWSQQLQTTPDQARAEAWKVYYNDHDWSKSFPPRLPKDEQKASESAADDFIAGKDFTSIPAPLYTLQPTWLQCFSSVPQPTWLKCFSTPTSTPPAALE